MAVAIENPYTTAPTGLVPARDFFGRPAAAIVPVSYAPVTKYDAGTVQFSRAQVVDLQGKVGGDAFKAASYALTNEAKIAPTPDMAHDYALGAAALSFANVVIKMRSYRASGKILSAVPPATFDPVQDRLAATQRRWERVRNFCFNVEKGTDAARLACLLAGGFLAATVGYPAGIAVSALGHVFNVTGFVGQTTSAIATLRSARHLHVRNQQVAPWILAPGMVKREGEKLQRRLMEAGHVPAAHHVATLLAVNQSEAIDPLVTAVTHFMNTHGGAQVFRRQPVIQTDDVHAAELRELQDDLLPDTATRLLTLRQIEQTTFGTTAAPYELPSKEAVIAMFRRLPPPAAKRFRNANVQPAWQRLGEAPIKSVQSMAALWCMVAELCAGDSATKIYTTVSGAHDLNIWLWSTLGAFSVVMPGISLVQEARSRTTAVQEGNPDNAFFHGAGVKSGMLMLAGAALFAHPITRPLGMYLATAGFGVQLVGKYLFHLYKEEPPAESGWLRRTAHRLYRWHRDRWVRRHPAPIMAAPQPKKENRVFALFRRLIRKTPQEVQTTT